MPLETLSVATEASPLGASRAIDSAADATVVDLKASSAKVFAVSINNRNGNAECFVQLFNAASGSVTLGSTAPMWGLPCPAGKRLTYWVRDVVANDGLASGSALSLAVVTGQGGSSAPTGTKPSVVVLFT